MSDTKYFGDIENAKGYKKITKPLRDKAVIINSPVELPKEWKIPQKMAFLTVELDANKPPTVRDVIMNQVSPEGLTVFSDRPSRENPPYPTGQVETQSIKESIKEPVKENWFKRLWRRLGRQ